MSTLTLVTLIVTGLVVAVLVVYLVGIIVALRRAGTHLEAVVQGLEEVAEDTSVLEGRVTAINVRLRRLAKGLGSVEQHLIGIARVLEL